MRMIDADALIAKLKDVCQHAEEPIAQMFICAAINDIKHAPTIEPSAQPNTSNTLESLDCIDRQAALDALKRAEALTRAFGYHYVIDTIQELPSAQPEIIRCNSCKHWTQTIGEMRGFGLGICDFHNAEYVTCNGFCYWAERRKGEQDA